MHVTADSNASAGLKIEPPDAEIRGDGLVIRVTLKREEQALR